MFGNYVCLSYFPKITFVNFYHKNVQIIQIDPCNLNFQMKKTIAVEETGHIKKILYKSPTNCILIFPKNLYILHYDSETSRIEHVFNISKKQIENGFYNADNGYFYGLSHDNLYLIDLKRKRTICTFVNIRVVILDNYRYFSPKTNDFLILFRHTNCSVYSSVNKWKSYVKFIQGTFGGTNIRYHCRFELYDVFSCKSNSTNKLLFFNYENQTLVKHCSLDIISSFFQIINYPDLLLFSVKIVHDAIKIHVNKLFPHFQNLFVFHLKKSFYDRIYHTEIILIHSFAFLLIMSETKTVIKYLFDLSNKTIVELYKQKLEVESIKTQLFHYKNILHTKRFVQNDCEEKTVAKCCICYSYNVNCMFLPCGHLCCCHHCGKNDKLSKCPLCRDSIESKQVTYISTK